MRYLGGGDEEDRTLDLTDANRTLSQLSYAPKYKSIQQRERCFQQNYTIGYDIAFEKKLQAKFPKSINHLQIFIVIIQRMQK